MKGKNTFTLEEINTLKRLIEYRVKADRSSQKRIRDAMRSIGFYGRDDFGIVDCQVSDLESLIRSGIIKVIGKGEVTNPVAKENNHLTTPKATSTTHSIGTAPIKSKDVELTLIQGRFVSVNTLNDNSVPAVPGLYCIKLRKGVILPAKYGKIRVDGIIYIGKADVLRERLWEEELNHQRPATFFRGIGAVLDYLPPKGSLVGKANQNNYKFSPEDTDAIRKWMRQSLLVNWVPMDAAMIGKVEETLIKQYQPLMNTRHNPNPSKELAAARKRCREYAQSK